MVCAQLAKAGLPPERLVWMDVADKAPYIARGSLADLFLDCPMCNGHTTGTDILWAGVPILTASGEQMASRVAASLLRASGGAAGVVGSLREYHALAAALANGDSAEPEAAAAGSSAQATGAAGLASAASPPLRRCRWPAAAKLPKVT